MKTLEKDRTRRYGSPTELAADIERHLTSQPVLASPPSVVYRMGKFVRRHRVGVAAGTIVLLALILGMVGTTVGMVRATRAEAQATQEAETAKQVSDFLVGLFEVSDPSEARGNEITAREILDKGAEKIDRELTDEPLVQARMMDTIGRVYFSLGMYRKADQLLERAITLRRQALGPAAPETLASMTYLAWARIENREVARAEPLFREIAEACRDTFGAEHEQTLSALTDLANVLQLKREYAEAETLLLRTIQAEERVLGEQDYSTIHTKFIAGSMYLNQGRYQDAERFYREAMEAARDSLGEDHPSTRQAMLSLGESLTRQGRYEEAESLVTAFVTISRRVVGNDDPTTLLQEGHLAQLYAAQGKYEQAERAFLDTIEAQRRVMGAGHLHTLLSMGRLAANYVDWGRLDEAERVYLDAIEDGRRYLGNSHRSVRVLIEGLVLLYEVQRRFGEARPFVSELLAIYREEAERAEAKGQAKNAYAWWALTCEPSDLREPESALRFALEANEMTGFRNATYLDTLALAYHLTGDTERAIETQSKAISLLPEDADRSEYEERLAEFESALRGKSE
jgi:non-specific serine/threonine protein kinase/serine/threonine-protein kinase